MSNPVSRTLSYAAGYVLMTFVIGALVLGLLSALLMWLVPVATGGDVTISWLQGIAVVTLAFLTRVVMFPTK